MLEINPVNLVQAAGLTISLFSLYLLRDHRHYAIIKVLLMFSGLSAVTNFAEEVLGSRDWYLVSPVYLLGIGPLFYLSVVSLTQNKNHPRYLVHLFPMFLALPFTVYPQWVIAMGSLWFVAYGWLTYHAASRFEQRIRAENSNAESLSLHSFMNLVVVVAIIYILDFVRLNTQPIIGPFWNNLGQLLANIAIYLGLAWFVKKLLQSNDDIVAYQQEVFDPSSYQSNNQNDNKSNDLAQTDPLKQKDAFEQSRDEAPQFHNLSAEDPGQYESIFQFLEQQIVEQQLFTQPRLSLAQLAQITGLQTRDISRAINLCAELNFNDYINQHRVNAVKVELTENQSASLLEIGLRNGFNSKTSFNNVFKRLAGMTPGQFRRESD